MWCNHRNLTGESAACYMHCIRKCPTEILISGETVQLNMSLTIRVESTASSSPCGQRQSPVLPGNWCIQEDQMDFWDTKYNTPTLIWMSGSSKQACCVSTNSAYNFLWTSLTGSPQDVSPSSIKPPPFNTVYPYFCSSCFSLACLPLYK
jgi:hypothetical protein